MPNQPENPVDFASTSKTMSLNNVNQRTDIAVPKLVVKMLEEDVNELPESPASLSHSEQSTDHRDDTYQQTIEKPHATEHGVVTIPVAVLASLKRQLDSAQASIANLERYAAQVESRHRVDLEHWISERSERARLEEALANEKRKSRFERDLEEIDKAIEALDVAWGKMQNNSSSSPLGYLANNQPSYTVDYMPKRLESPIYLTFTSITMPSNSILEDIKQRATIARLKLVVQSLDQNLAKPHKSIAEHSIRYGQLTEDHQERATFFRSLHRVVQDMFEIEDRAKTIMAASLADFDALGSNTDQRLVIERDELGRKLASLKSDLEDQKRAKSMAAMGDTMGGMLKPFLMDE